jgi:cellobiose phosphorylase
MLNTWDVHPDSSLPERQALGEGEEGGTGCFLGTRGTLYEHCLRAIRKGVTQGPHGLPLIGTGDWNDGMNSVGDKGKGESIWLGWFITIRSCALPGL